MLGQASAHFRGSREVQSECGRSTAPPPKSRNSTFFLHVLVAYGVIVGALHWTISWYISSHSGGDAQSPQQARRIPALSRESRPQHAGDAQRVLRDHFTCVDRMALYYAPPSTQPRLEDFEFLMHAMRVWKATRFTASMVVLIDPANASHRPLARAHSLRVSILGRDPDGSVAILVGSAGVCAALLHQRPHSLRVAILGRDPDGSGAVVFCSAGVCAALLHQRPHRVRVAILGRDVDRSVAILVGSAGLGAALLDLKVPHHVSLL